jgi:epoxyqueuosine reductase
MTLTERIREKAYDLGFDLIGCAPAGVAPHAEAFRRWLAKGYHAEMHWMARDPERRIDPRRVVEGARSLVVVGMSYFAQNPPPQIWDDPSRGRIARYAWGRDYHDVMTPRLRELGRFIDRELDADRNQRSYVDTGPVLEKDFATKAGIGFAGKNTLVINPGFGSYLFLGEIVIDVELDYDAPATAGFQDYNKPGGRTRRAACGACTRCLDACPTGAIVAPYELDSGKCISYHTIENKGSIPEDLRPKFGNWIYGCDVCQEVCPWVKQFSRPGRAPFLSYDPDRAAPKLADIMALTEAAFRERFRGTPIVRTKRRGLLRNAAIALANWGSDEALGILCSAQDDVEPLVREHVRWAIGRIQASA